MYVETPQLEGFWDNLKAAYDRLRKVKPLQVIAREAGIDVSRQPQASISYAEPAKIGGIPLSGTNLAIAAGVLLLLMSRKRR